MTIRHIYGKSVNLGPNCKPVLYPILYTLSSPPFPTNINILHGNYHLYIISAMYVYIMYHSPYIHLFFPSVTSNILKTKKDTIIHGER